MKRIIAISLMFIFFAIAAYCQTADDAMYEEASKYYDAKEYDNVIPILNELVLRDHAKALNLLGICYEYGKGVDKDRKKAVYYYQKSADLGFRSAQRNLGICYEYGKGVPINKEKAYFWYEKSFPQYKDLAEKGDSDAQLEVGVFYYYGRMRSGQDYLKSIPWFEKSANQGNGDACNLLGLIYQNAYGVEKDPQKAYEYFLKGAEKGNRYAQRNLAWLFQDDDFEEQHVSEGADGYLHYDFDFYKQTEKWLRKAAAQDADYMYELACFYLDMQISDDWKHIDPVLWLKKAAEAGSAQAQAALGYNCLLNKEHREALLLFQLAKKDGIDAFQPFEYEESKNINIDLALMICLFLDNHREYNLKNAYMLGNNLLAILENENGNKGFIQLSKTGSIVNKTPFIFKDAYISDELHFLMCEDNDGLHHSVLFLDSELNLDLLNVIFDYLKEHEEYRAKEVIIMNEFIYAFLIGDNEKQRCLKMSKTGKVLALTPFVNHMGFVHHYSFDENEQLVMDYFYCDFDGIDLSFIGNDINLDILFPLITLYLNDDKGYELLECVYADSMQFIVSTRYSDNQYRWLKLSTKCDVIASTLSSRTEYSYDKYEKIFSYYDNEVRHIEFGEMMKLFK